MPDDEVKYPVPFGKYLLTGLIAVGGMAEVYRAKIFGASGFEKEMVVKRILPRYAKNPNFVQMLIDEAKIAVNLSHGNIVPIYELGEFEGSYYIAMEFVQGQTILDLLRLSHGKQRALSWQNAFHICAGVASGLAYAHTRKGPDGKNLNLVHRDINPRNIVVTSDGEVKILDFGIARASTKKHQTQSGVIKGTPGYMSPEQMKGQSIDHRSDIYCVGILLHELLTLKRLFPVWTVKEMRELFARRPPVKPSSIAPHLPADVDEVLMRALSEDLATRYQHAGEFEQALRAAVARSGHATTDYSLGAAIAEIQNSPIPDTTQISRADAANSAATSHETPTSRSSSGEDHDDPIPSSASPIPQSSADVTKTPPPLTQPMQAQQSEQPSAREEHAFVISLASDPKQGRTPAPVPLAPLPHTTTGSDVPRTQVLAKNDEVSWSNRIGNDAELLALQRAAGSAPGQVRNRVLIAAAVLVAVLIPLGAFYAPEIQATIERALAGKKVRQGAIVVKTKPSGAEVILDGKSRGKSNLKLTGVDPDRPHQLVLKRGEGKRPIILEFGPKDFVPLEGLPTYTFDRSFEDPAPENDGGPAKTQTGASDTDDTTKAKTSGKKSKKKTKKKKRRRRR